MNASTRLMNDALESPALPTNDLDAAAAAAARHRRDTLFWFGYGAFVATTGCVGLWALFRYVL